jgi:hypothetical protein
VYRLQRYLHAIKVCEMCQWYQPVDDFDGWGAQPCNECRAELRRAKRAEWR